MNILRKLPSTHLIISMVALQAFACQVGPDHENGDHENAVRANDFAGQLLFDGSAVAGANISLLDAATLQHIDSAISDEYGEFVMEAPDSDREYLFIAYSEQDDGGLFAINEIEPDEAFNTIDLQKNELIADQDVEPSTAVACGYTTYYGASAYTCQYCDGSDPDIDTAVTYNLNESFYGWGISHHISANTTLGATILWYHNNTLLVNQKGYINGHYKIETVMGQWYEYFSLTAIKNSMKVTNVVLCP